MPNLITPPPATSEQLQEAARACSIRSLHDCLAPLAAAAVETSLLAYAWGLQTKQLMRAGVVMDLAGDVIKQANAILTHESSAPGGQGLAK